MFYSFIQTFLIIPPQCHNFQSAQCELLHCHQGFVDTPQDDCLLPVSFEVVEADLNSLKTIEDATIVSPLSCQCKQVYKEIRKTTSWSLALSSVSSCRFGVTIKQNKIWVWDMEHNNELQNITTATRGSEGDLKRITEEMEYEEEVYHTQADVMTLASTAATFGPRSRTDTMNLEDISKASHFETNTGEIAFGDISNSIQFEPPRRDRMNLGKASKVSQFESKKGEFNLSDASVDIDMMTPGLMTSIMTTTETGQSLELLQDHWGHHGFKRVKSWWYLELLHHINRRLVTTGNCTDKTKSYLLCFIGYKFNFKKGGKPIDFRSCSVLGSQGLMIDLWKNSRDASNNIQFRDLKVRAESGQNNLMSSCRCFMFVTILFIVKMYTF